MESWAAFLDSTEDPYATERLRRGVPSHSQLRVECAFGAGNTSDLLSGPFRGLITGQVDQFRLGDDPGAIGKPCAVRGE